MNKSMVIGLLGGIGIATAGGVAGYALMSQPATNESGSAMVEETIGGNAAESTTAAAPVQAAAQPAAAPAPVVEQRCWDEEVTVQADPTDERAIAGTAAGAILGGAIAKRLGDDNDLATAAGAAAGAFAGRRVQRQVQENNTTTVIERRCEPAQ